MQLSIQTKTLVTKSVTVLWFRQLTKDQSVTKLKGIKQTRQVLVRRIECFVITFVREKQVGVTRKYE
jgi:phosphoribosylaminoimidazole-succinocarboxamide synthase